MRQTDLGIGQLVDAPLSVGDKGGATDALLKEIGGIVEIGRISAFVVGIYLRPKGNEVARSE